METSLEKQVSDRPSSSGRLSKRARMQRASEGVDSQGTESQRRAKGHRRRGASTSAAEPAEPTPCFFVKLPFELLAEILILSRSTRQVLAVARCSKYHCATLLHPSSEFIWKTVRRLACPEGPQLPDPLPYLSEAAYAALVFDGGVCDVNVKFS